jgi:Malectin domain
MNNLFSKRLDILRVGFVWAVIGACLLLAGKAAAQTVTVDASATEGALNSPGWYNDQSRVAPLLGPGDISTIQTLGTHVTRGWVRPEDYYDPTTNTYNFAEAYPLLDQINSYSQKMLINITGNGLAVSSATLERVMRDGLINYKTRYPNIVFIECLNEPDFGGISTSAYYGFYQDCYQAVNDANAQLNPAVPLQIGGPVALNSAGTGFLTTFLDNYKNDTNPAKRLDFLSYHQYNILNDPKKVASEGARDQGWFSTRGIPTTTPIFVTEYGPFPGGNTGTTFNADILNQAACMLAAGYYYVTNGVQMPMNWVLRHATETRKNELVPNVDGDLTPYGNMILMQTMLQPTRVSTVSDTNSSAGIGLDGFATEGPNSMAIIVWNYQGTGTKSYNASVQINNLNTVFGGSNMHLEQYLIDSTHSNYTFNSAATPLEKVQDTTLAGASSTRLPVTLETNAITLFVLTGSGSPPPTPNPPTNLGATAISSNQINLSWTASTTSGVTYSIFRSTTSGFTAGSGNQIASGVATTTFSDTSLAASTTYFYLAEAVGSSGTSVASNQASATTTGTTCAAAPTAPSGLTATAASSNQVNLSWTASTAGTGCAVSYTVTRNGSQVATGLSGTTFSDTGLGCNMFYTYTVAASDAAGSSAASSPASASTNCGVPPSVQINAGGPTVNPFVADVDFTGGATIDHANTIDTSKVTLPAPAAVYQSARVTATAGAGTTFSYTIGGFPAGSSQLVRLHFAETFHTTAGSRVFNVSINGTQVLTNFDIFATAGGQNIANIQQFTEPANSSGEYVIVFTTVTDKALVSGIEVIAAGGGCSSVPTTPTGLTATTISNNEIDLAWTASTAPAGCTVAYSITHNNADLVTALSGTTFKVTGMACNTTETYQVFAADVTGSSNGSNTATATTSACSPNLQINSGGPAVAPFVADEDFTGGATINHANTINTSKVTNPAPAAVYQSARVTATAGAGTTFSYTIGGFTPGSSQLVRLHFAETFHTTAGSRVFNVSINGTQVLTNFDIFATAGGENIANIQEFLETPNSSGQYVIVFTTVTDKALISGIEID